MNKLYLIKMKINRITSNELNYLSGVNNNIQYQIDNINLDNIINGDNNKFITNNRYDNDLIVPNLNIGYYYYLSFDPKYRRPHFSFFDIF